MPVSTPETRKALTPGFRSLPIRTDSGARRSEEQSPRLRHLGRPEAARNDYNRQAADLKANRKPRPTAPGSSPPLTKRANRYLTYPSNKAQRKLITPGWLRDCESAIDAFVKFAGKGRGEDFPCHQWGHLVELSRRLRQSIMVFLLIRLEA